MRDLAVAMSEFGKLLLTRERGREIAARLPKSEHLLLDFQGVDVASPSFLDETIRGAFALGATELTFANTSRATKDNLDRILNARPSASSGDGSEEAGFPDIELVG